MANYLYEIGDYEVEAWETKGLAVVCYTAAVLVVLFHTRASYWISNAIGAVKPITLVFISILGLWCWVVTPRSRTLRTDFKMLSMVVHQHMVSPRLCTRQSLHASYIQA